ncbi:MAG: hypothetical protein ACRCTJ_03930 [Brevinema sp.]
MKKQSKDTTAPINGSTAYDSDTRYATVITAIITIKSKVEDTGNKRILSQPLLAKNSL